MTKRKQEAIVKELKPGLFNIKASSTYSYFTMIDATELFIAGIDTNDSGDRNFYKIIHLNYNRVLTNN